MDTDWWDDSETRTVSVDGADTAFTGDVIKLQVGPEMSTAGLTAGDYDNCCLIIFDTNHVEGTPYSSDIQAEVIGSCDIS